MNNNSESAEKGPVNIKKDFKFYLQLFWLTFKISSMTFGGGFVIIAFFKKMMVEKLGWMREEEMLDLLAVAQCSPGAIAVNAAFLIGYRLAGALGTSVTVFATVLPPFVVNLAAYYGYRQLSHLPVMRGVMAGIQAAVAAILLEIALTLVIRQIKGRSPVAIITISAVFLSLFIFSVNVAFIILACVGVGMIFCRPKTKEEK